MDSNFMPNLRQKMEKAIEILRSDFSTIRTGKAAPSLVENIMVSVYNGASKLRVMEVATINAADSQSLVLTPFDASIIEEIRKGIMEGGSGLNPASDGQVIRINVPPLSEERRQELIHMMRQKLENGKIMIRQIRHEAMESAKKEGLSEDDEKRLEKEIQTLTDQFMGEIDLMGKKKEEELMQI
ncbi:MAG: ribosome recycling factor [Candidatus Levybacteria bacterium]|nr:ribosome recycling factor [Candidatus Levybacteria bacterium]MBI2420459.1 ribosome recycling factor [Candidatus Levybacteria bacterium]